MQKSFWRITPKCAELANYYGLANEAKTGLNKLMYMAQSSFLATLAQKNQSSISTENSRLQQETRSRGPGQDKEGKPKVYTLQT